MELTFHSVGAYTVGRAKCLAKMTQAVAQADLKVTELVLLVQSVLIMPGHKTMLDQPEKVQCETWYEHPVSELSLTWAGAGQGPSYQSIVGPTGQTYLINKQKGQGRPPRKPRRGLRSGREGPPTVA